MTRRRPARKGPLFPPGYLEAFERNVMRLLGEGKPSAQRRFPLEPIDCERGRGHVWAFRQRIIHTFDPRRLSDLGALRIEKRPVICIRCGTEDGR